METRVSKGTIFAGSNPIATARLVVTAPVLAVLLLSSCSTPTLVEMTRQRYGAAHDVHLVYKVTDLDVLNFTDEVKRKLSSHSSFHLGVQYGAAGAQATLTGLAGAAKVIGWGLNTASGLGLGATYIFGMSRIFDAKAHAQAYEQAFTAIQAAEATFYFHQLGMTFTTGSDGHPVVDSSGAKNRGDIPSEQFLTPDGETLYYRVSKILKVLDDTLAAKIPDLQDLKDATGESTAGSPAKSKDTEQKSASPNRGVNPAATVTPTVSPTPPNG